MVYEPDAPSGRTLSLTLTCPHDLGYEPWNGKRIVLRATDVHAMQLFTWPVVGGETVTGVHPHISERMREVLLRSTLRRSWPFEVHVEIASGSWLEFICEKVEIVVV